MNPTSKKLVSLFLVFSLMMLSTNLYGKKRRGAKVVITKKDGRLIRGELIAVKEHSLLLLAALDVSIDIGNIKVIEINKKKSKAGKGALNGLLICGGVGALVGGIAFSGHTIESEGIDLLSGALMAGVVFGAAGAAVGAIIGATRGLGGKTIHFEGMTDTEIQETLEYLRKKARIRDYR